MSNYPVKPYSLAFILSAFVVSQFAMVSPAAFAADYSHARVVRLSLVQGEVKVSRTGDAGNGSGRSQAWEQAGINLPIREGFVVATGQGRTEVEFESGAAAYLAENSVLQFTELALSGGARITKLTLTQGTATIFANPSHEDSFVVKTPTLEVSLTKKGRIRLDTYDDGASVSALKGEAVVTSAAGATHIGKGQSLSLRADNPNNASISSIPKDDEWDRWVADREESVQSTATMTANRLDSPYYQAGVAELSVYGTWVSYGGYSNCWRPVGVSFGWRPFSSGRWSFYPGFGWTWVSAEPWGWLPYHFGGWVFSPMYGWLWVPGQPHQWQAEFRPATAVFVQVNNHVGWLPSHPLDQRGGRPLNMEQGFLSENDGAGVVPMPVAPDARVQVLADAPRGVWGGGFHAAAPPERVSRRFGEEQGRHEWPASGSGIVYDGRERRFVNANPPPGSPTDNHTSDQENGATWNGNSRDLHHVQRDVDAPSGVRPAVVMPTAPVTPSGPSAPAMQPRRGRRDDGATEREERGIAVFGNNPRTSPDPQPAPGGAAPAPPPETTPPANIRNFRRMNRDNDDNLDRSDSPRNRGQWSSPPRESMPPMRSAPSPSAQPRVEPSRPTPMAAPAPEPRAEPARPPASSPRGGAEWGGRVDRGTGRPHQQQ